MATDQHQPPPYFLHGACDELSNLLLTVGADGANLGNLLGGADHLGSSLEHLHRTAGVYDTGDERIGRYRR
jgi:hypothetical protein